MPGLGPTAERSLRRAERSGTPLAASERAALRENLGGLIRELEKDLAAGNGRRAAAIQAAARRALERLAAEG